MMEQRRRLPLMRASPGVARMLQQLLRQRQPDLLSPDAGAAHLRNITGNEKQTAWDIFDKEQTKTDGKNKRGRTT